MTYRYFTQDGVLMIEISVDAHNQVVRYAVPEDRVLYPPPPPEEAKAKPKK